MQDKKTHDHHMVISVTPAERGEIVAFRKQNPHIKMNGEMARLVLAYIRGNIPETMIDRSVRPVKEQQHVGISRE